MVYFCVNASYFFARVNCGYKPPKLIGTSDPTMITFELMISGGNTCASGVEVLVMCTVQKILVLAHVRNLYV